MQRLVKLLRLLYDKTIHAMISATKSKQAKDFIVHKITNKQKLYNITSTT